MLKPTQLDRRGRPIAERILATGREGTTKTSAWISIARMAAASKSPAKFWVIDTDFCVDLMLSEDPGNIAEVYEVNSWTDYMNAVEKIIANVDESRGDWVVLDKASRAWALVQNDACERMWGMTLAEYQEKNVTRKAPPDLPWNQINSVYDGIMQPILLPIMRFHVFAVASAKKIGQGDKEHSVSRSLYEAVGEKADGQYLLGSNVHTVLHFSMSPQRRAAMTTVKDRAKGRAYVTDYAIPDTPFSFAQEYLLGIAGWSLK